jgi:alanine dehydrogenase
MLFLSRKEVEDLLEPRELIAALEDGFKSLSSNLLNVPPRNQTAAPGGILAGMPAYMPGLLMSVKLVSVFHQNHLQNIPDHQAVIALFDPQTGSPAAFMDGEVITAWRTAAGAMISIKHLARQDSKTLAIIGAGVLGAAHLSMIATLNGIEHIRIASRDYSRAVGLAKGIPNAQAAASNREAVAGADIVCLCTSSLEPVIQGAWLKPGVHISSVGYRPPQGSELPRNLVEAAALFVESRVAFEAPPAGCVELQGLDPACGAELGEVLLKTHPGRRSPQETTIYKSMGHAMEDLVAANLVYQKARSQNIGRNIEL